MKKRWFLSYTCLLVTLVFMFSMVQVVLPKPARAVNVQPLPAESVEAQNPDSDPPEPSGDFEEPATSEEPSTEPEESEAIEEPEEEPEEPEDMPELGEPLEGEYLLPIDQATYEALVAAQPKLSQEEEAAELEKYTHTIQNDDGTFTKRIYLEPVRYQDENGIWQDIDTSLIQSKADANKLVNAGGEVDVVFDTQKSSGLETTIRKDKYKVSFRQLPIDETTTQEEFDSMDFGEIFANTETVLIDAPEAAKEKEVGLSQAKPDLSIGAEKREKIEDNKEEFNSIDDEQITTDDLDTVLESATSYDAVKYKGALESAIDMKLTPTSQGVKEEIILKSPTNMETFSYIINLEALVPVLKYDGNTLLVDKQTNEIVGMISLPIMYDSAEEVSESYDIDVSIQKLSETEYLYQLTPDRQWLDSSSRVYPVTIDPNWKYEKNANMADTQVSHVKPTTNFVSDVHLRIGRDNTNNAVYRSYLYFNIPAVFAANRRITAATLGVYEDYVGASTINGRLYQTNTFNASTLTWNSQPAALSQIGTQSITNTGWYRYSIGTQVQNRYENKAGLYLMISSDQENVNRFKRFFSSENSSANKPYLDVTYVTGPPPPGSVTVSPTTWTKGNITVKWSTVTATEGTTISHYEYSTTSETAGFARLTGNGSQSLELPDGSKHVWVRAVNNYGLAGTAKQSSTKYNRDNSRPSIPTLSIEPSPANNSMSPNRRVTWSASTDVGSGVNHYTIQKRTRSYTNGSLGAWTDWVSCGTVNVSSTREYIAEHQSGSMLQYRVNAVDKCGNEGGWGFSSEYVMPHYGKPTAPETITITPEGWSNNTTPTVSWAGITGENIKNAQYSITGINNGMWNNIPVEMGIKEGSFELDLSALEDGEHIISLRGITYDGIAGDEASVSYFLTTALPNAALSIELSENENEANIQVDMSSSTEIPLRTWRLMYGFGTEQPLDTLIPIIEDEFSDTPLSFATEYQWDISGLSASRPYNVYLIVEDIAGNTAVERVSFVRSYGHVWPEIEITAPLDRITSPITRFEFRYIQEELADEPINNAELVFNNRPISNSDNGRSLYFDATAKLEGSTQENPLWQYPEGQMSFAYIHGQDADGVDIYSDAWYEYYVIDTTVGLSGGLITSHTSRGYEVGGNIFSAELYVEETVYMGVEHRPTYEISFDDQKTWYPIDPYCRAGANWSDAVYNENNRFFIDPSISSNKVNVRTNLVSNVRVGGLKLKVRHMTYTNAVLIDNDFGTNARGFTGMNNTWHMEGQGSIVLENATSGSVDSTVRTVSADVQEAVLQVQEVKPEGTDITYQISTDGGITFENISPGDYNNPDDWLELKKPGREVVLRATLHSNSIGVTPELKAWTLGITVNATGQGYVIQLVDEPSNLSTLTNVNYSTLLRWKAAEDESDITYNVYRSETPYFTPSEETLLVSGIRETNYTDINLNYGKVFYYQVTAVKDIDGYPRESLPSNQAWARVVEQGEVQKRLGLQDYWSYAGFTTGMGDGYINVNNGNLAYVSTDMVISDPFFAMTMRRTYNSLATTKTPMGYGWDFSFNTTLLREFDETGTQEIGMILKDGDGTFHRFPIKNDGTYESAKGTFMKFTYDEAAGEYTITRKDNVVYHFDAQSMKLISFSNPNNNELKFTYDVRGNLCEVENTVGDKLYIEYYVSSSNPGMPDYTYINEHVDMVEKVRWEGSGGAVLEYTYEYGGDDKLDKSVILDEGNNEYKEEFVYDEGGKLLSITNAENQTVGLSYDDKSRIDRVNTPVEGIYNTFSYITVGDTVAQAQVQDELGNSTIYLTQADGLLVKTIDPLGHEIEYTHNDDFLVTGMSYVNHVMGVPSQINHEYSYDNYGNLLSAVGPAGSEIRYEGYNTFSKPTKMRVKQSGSTWRETIYTYDNYGNLTATKDPSGKTITNSYGTLNGNAGYLISQTDRLGKTTSYTYDTMGRVTKITESGGGQSRDIISYTYDAYGHTATQTDAEGRAVRMTYSKLGLLTQTQYVDGTVNKTDYTLLGQKTRETDARGGETRYTYDELGRLSGVTQQDGTINLSRYLKWDSDGDGVDDADKVVSVDGEGRESIDYYDKAGRIIKQNSSGITINYEFDYIGNVIKQIDGEGRVVVASYNSLGQLVEQAVDPDGINIVTKYEYDLIGNKTRETDALGNHTNYTYDELDRLKTVQQTANGQTMTTTYTYDVVEGNYIRNSITDAKGNRSDTLFDLLGNKVMDRRTGMQTQYSYNAAGSVNIVTRNDQTKVRYEYDNMGRMSSIYYYDANENVQGASNHYFIFEYDAAGNPTRETVVKNGVRETTTYAYDIMNRVRQYVQGENDTGLSIDYVYNQAGQIIETQYHKSDNQVYQGGQGAGYQVTHYDYDEYGRLSSISAGTADTLTGASTSKKLVREYFYTSGGDLSYANDYPDFKNGGTRVSKTSYVYDSAGRATNVRIEDYSNSGASGVLKEAHTTTFDKNSNITSEAIQTTYDGNKTVNKSYVYDEIGRLTSATDDGERTTYTYDLVGNRTGMTQDGKEYTYAYNNLDQLTSISEGGIVRSTYTYDARGNQTKVVTEHFRVTPPGGSERVDNKVTEHSFDLVDQLTSSIVTTPVIDELTGDRRQDQVDKIYNDYSAAGKRIKRIETFRGVEETSRYYYMGDSVLYTSNEESVLQTENILDLDGTILMSFRFLQPYQAEGNEFANQWYTYRYDVRGSVTNITNPSGEVVKEYEYNEFGETTVKGVASFKNDITFTGSVKDTSTGLQYMNARFYEPATGRFLSQDTYSGNAYDPWTQNLYSYCGNNPVNMIDPTGHASQYVTKNGVTYLISDKTLAMYTREAGNAGLKWTNFSTNAYLYSSLFSFSKSHILAIGEAWNRIDSPKVYDPNGHYASSNKGYSDKKYMNQVHPARATVGLYSSGAMKGGSVNPINTQLVNKHVADNNWSSYDIEMMNLGFQEQAIFSSQNPNYYHTTAIHNGKVFSKIVMQQLVEWTLGKIGGDFVEIAINIYNAAKDAKDVWNDHEGLTWYWAGFMEAPYIGHDIREWSGDDYGWNYDPKYGYSDIGTGPWQTFSLR